MVCGSGTKEYTCSHRELQRVVDDQNYLLVIFCMSIWDLYWLITQEKLTALLF